MTWSYSGDPSASDLDALRFTIGDTDSSDEQFSDEELTYLLTQNSDAVVAAALAACRMLIARYSLCVDQKTGDIDVKHSQRIAQLREVMAQLREGLMPSPYAGGISKSDIDTVNDDDDRQRPEFGLGMMDYPSTDPQRSGGTGGVL